MPIQQKLTSVELLFSVFRQVKDDRYTLREEILTGRKFGGFGGI